MNSDLNHLMLLKRADGDNRSDDEVKEDILRTVAEDYNILMVYDSDGKFVLRAHNIGVPSLMLDI